MSVRRPSRTRAGAALVMCGGVLAAAALAGPPPATAAAGDPPRLDWKSCGDAATPALQCAMLEVPLDHDRPDGRTVKIALNRLPATAPPGERQGPMLLNPGGPGISGLWMASWIPSRLPPDVAAAYDWIGFDLRGSQHSEPRMSCDPHYFDGPRPDFQVGQGTTGAWLEKAAGYVAKCTGKHSWLLPHLSTVDHVGDMESIRRALGAEKINFFGWSYGTTLGSTYAQLYPRHVRRFVLDSIVGPSVSWYDHNVLQDLQHEKRFKAFTAWVAKADGVYHLGTDPAEVEARWYAMRTRLREHPVGRIGPDEFDDTQVAGGYDVLRWPRLATVLSAYTNSGDSAPLVTAYERYAAPDPADDSFDLYNAVMCSDSKWPRDFRYWRKDQAKVNEKAPFYTYNNMWFNAGCLTWPVKAGNRTRITGRGLPPMLLFQATDDPATPYEGGLAMARALPSARLVVERGGGSHAITFAGNTCLDDLLVGYLRGGKVPSDRGLVDRTCAKNPDPAPVWVTPAPAAATRAKATALPRQFVR
ncbi:alpha/beta hydrolase [Actinomadura sp. NPDC023710]|uniref:alpha/beta hydrolase n=1 Tax=Actinomadura sp. NPDC023710 TaxID=3158219 RepID=UPI003405ACBE